MAGQSHARHSLSLVKTMHSTNITISMKNRPVLTLRMERYGGVCWGWSCEDVYAFVSKFVLRQLTLIYKYKCTTLRCVYNMTDSL